MKTKMLKLLFCVALLNFCHTVEAQIFAKDSGLNFFKKDSLKNRNVMLIQAEFENGGMIHNNAQIREDFSDIYYNGFNLRVGWQTEGKNVYHRTYNYPIYGVGFYRSTFGKKEIGTPTALYGFVAVPFAPHRFKRLDFNYRIGLGLANHFHPYDSLENPLNVLLGSARNVYIDAGLQANYRLGQHFYVGLGVAFHHFSNGSIRQPNKGINLIPLAVSLTYKPSKRIPEFIKEPVPPFEPQSQIHFSYAWGFKQFNPQNPRQYFKSTLGLYWSKSLGYKFRIGAGADIYYSDSGNHRIFAGDKVGKFGALFSGGPAFYIDNTLTNNLYINGNIGYYLHRNNFNGEVGDIFLKIGVRYKFQSNLFAGVSIKAHAGKADYVEWTLGYSIFNKKYKT